MAAGDVTRELFLQGRAAWPSLVVEYEAFREHCTRVTAQSDGDGSAFGLELYLCHACAGGDAAAMSVVAHRYGVVVSNAIARIAPDPDFARETAQEFWQRLFARAGAKIASYSGRGPLDAWMRVVATRLALDRCRARRRAATRELELGEFLAAEYGDPESHLLEERYTDALQAALRDALTALSARERNMLRIHVFGGAGIDEIGRIFGVHRATAARWLERMRKRLRDATRSNFARDCPGLTASEYHSIARALEGAVELGSIPGRSDGALHTTLSSMSGAG